MALYDKKGSHLVAAIRVPKYVTKSTVQHREFLLSVTQHGKKVNRGAVTEEAKGVGYSVGFIYDRFWKRNDKPVVHEVEWNVKHPTWVCRLVYIYIRCVKLVL